MMQAAPVNLPSARLLWILLVLTLMLLARNYGAELFSQVSIHYNEGPLLDQAMRLVRGEALYRADLSAPPYVVTNYGPVYHLLQWPFLEWFGPTFVPARVITIASHFAAAWLALLIMACLTGSRAAGAVSGLAVLASPLIGGMEPLVRVDVLAQGLSLAGIFTALVARTRRHYALAALFFTAAIYTKQSYILVGPATVFLYLLYQRRHRPAGFFAAALALMVSGVFLLGDQLTGGGFTLNLLLANINAYLPGRFFDYLKLVLVISPVAFCLPLAIGFMRRPPPGALVFVGIYFALSALVSAAAGKIGSNEGYFSELHVALAWLMGLLVSPAGRISWRHDTTLLVGAQLLIYGFVLFTSPYHHFLRVHQDEQLQVKKRIESTPGDILADAHMGLLSLSGRRVYYQPFEMMQLLKSGRWSQDKFLSDLRAQKFPLIIIQADLRQQRWSPEMLTIISERYHPAESIGTSVVWRPD